MLAPLRPERWRDDLLGRILWITFVLGAVVCVPSVAMALSAGIYVVAVGDAAALALLGTLTLAESLGPRIRALGYCAVLYLLGAMLMVFVGPIAQIYLLGFSVMATMLLGLRHGMFSAGINAITMVGLGGLALAAPGFVSEAWGDDLASWIVMTMNFLLINSCVVAAIGAVLHSLEAGVEREATARAALAEREALLAMATKVGQLGAWSVDVPSRKVTWSDQTRAIFEVPADYQPQMDSVFDFVIGEDRGGLAGVVARAQTVGESFTREVRIRTARGRLRELRVIGRPIRDEAGTLVHLQGTLQDVTDQRRLEEHLHRAQRIESIGTLAGGIAHDLNNVLTPILTSVELLREEEVDAQKLSDLSLIERSARRGASMIKQLLDFARGRRGAAEEALDLRHELGEILGIVRDTFPRDVEVISEIGDDDTGALVGAVRADPTQIHQLVTNLCVNARDAMPQGGRLTLRLAEVHIDALYAANIPDANPGPYLRVDVEDTGEGMSREVQDRIFEPFFTTKQTGKGTGLGLSTCHSITQRLGGFIQVYSELGRGTRIRVYLPVIPPPPPATPSPATPSPAAPSPAAPSREAMMEASDAGVFAGHGELVLVIDDDTSILTVTCRTLEHHGYRTLSAANGIEALARFDGSLEPVDVVLTDMSMPQMDGPSVVAALRERAPSLPIVGTSGLGDEAPLTMAARAQLEAFVEKPYTTTILLQALRACIDRARSAP